MGKYYDLLVDIKAAEKALTDVNSEWIISKELM